jgi:hypothetical protein
MDPRIVSLEVIWDEDEAVTVKLEARFNKDQLASLLQSLREPIETEPKRIFQAPALSDPCACAPRASNNPSWPGFPMWEPFVRQPLI